MGLKFERKLIVGEFINHRYSEDDYDHLRQICSITNRIYDKPLEILYWRIDRRGEVKMIKEIEEEWKEPYVIESNVWEASKIIDLKRSN